MDSASASSAGYTLPASGADSVLSNKSPHLVLKYLHRLFSSPYNTTTGVYWDKCFLCRGHIKVGEKLPPQELKLRRQIHSLCIKAVSPTLFMNIKRSEEDVQNTFGICEQGSKCFNIVLELLHLHKSFKRALLDVNKARKNLVKEVVETFLIANVNNPKFSTFGVDNVVKYWCGRIGLNEEEEMEGEEDTIKLEFDAEEVKIELQDQPEFDDDEQEDFDNSFLIIPDCLADQDVNQIMKEDIDASIATEDDRSQSEEEIEYLPNSYHLRKSARLKFKVATKATKRKGGSKEEVHRKTKKSLSNEDSDFDYDIESEEAEGGSSSDETYSEEEEEEKPKAKKKKTDENTPKRTRAPPLAPGEPRPKRIRKKKMAEECTVCGKMVVGLYCHMRIHTGERPHKCPQCDQAFVKTSDMYSHIRRKHEENKHMCEICPSTFPENFQLKMHMKKNHLDGKKKEVFRCQVCGQYCNILCNLKKHMTRHEKATRCPLCKITFPSKEELDQHVYTNENHLKLLKQKDKTSRHKKHKKSMINIINAKAEPVPKTQKEKNERKPNICSHCKEIFSNLMEMYKHIKAKHPEIRSFMCEICGKAFYDNSTFRKHVDNHTDDKKKFNCFECGKKFRFACTLKNHMVCHTTTPTSQCHLCPEGFRAKFNLRQHLVVAHEKAYLEDKPFLCRDVCFMKFESEEELSEHMKNHEKNHRCQICARWFRSGQHLRVHMRTHTGEKPLKCTICDKSFSQGINLKEHLLRHTGERPHKCPNCGDGFIRRKQLNEHILKCEESN